MLEKRIIIPVKVKSGKDYQRHNVLRLWLTKNNYTSNNNLQ